MQTTAEGAHFTKAYVKDGTDFAEAASHGFDPAGPNDSQAYITEVATRALIFIEADCPGIGLMCVMAVGMAEVSTCRACGSSSTITGNSPASRRRTLP